MLLYADICSDMLRNAEMLRYDHMVCSCMRKYALYMLTHAHRCSYMLIVCMGCGTMCPGKGRGTICPGKGCGTICPGQGCGTICPGKGRGWKNVSRMLMYADIR